MSYKVQNILVGASAVYLSVKDSTDPAFISGGLYGPALPAEPTAASYVPSLDADTTNWRSTGFTSAGVEVSYEPTYGEIEVDQLLDSAKLFKQSFKVAVNTTFAEATLENLMVAWGQQSSTLNGSVLGIAAGNLGDEPVERSIAFVGPAPRNSSSNKKQERVYVLHRALSVQTTAHAQRRNEATQFPVSFRVLPDPARSGQEYGSITDRVVVA